MLHFQYWMICVLGVQGCSDSSLQRDLGFLHLNSSKAENRVCQGLAQAADLGIGCFVNSCFGQTVSRRDLALNSYCGIAFFN